MKRAWAVLPAAVACAALVSCERSPPAVDRSDPGGSLRKAGASAALKPIATEAVESRAATAAPLPLASATATAVPNPIRLAPPLRPDASPSLDPGEPATRPPPTTLPTAPASGATGAVRVAAPRSYPPRNECGALPNYPAFRAILVAAVRNRDAEALAALADPDIKLDFGGGSGRGELRRRLGQPRRGLWRELGEILRLGCAADGDLVTMPWVFSRMPESVDPYRAMLVTGDKVALRQQPASDAPVLAELSWALVEPAGDKRDPSARFVEVKSGDGKTRGFVESATLRSLLAHRLIAEPQKEGWAITAFIAGD